MNRVDFAGGSYCDANPDGAFVVLMSGRHLSTHRGHIALPVYPHASGKTMPFDVLQVRIAPDGAQFAGVGATGPHADTALHWKAGAWDYTGRLAYGPSSVIFDRQNRLRVHSDRTQGPIGYRYVDEQGNIITGEATYIDSVRHIYEWTQYGDLTIGQGGEGPHGQDPVIALYQGKRYVLAEGQCRFIRFTRTGERLAVSWVNQHNGSATILWLAASEIPTFPEQRRTGSTKPPPPPPPTKKEPMEFPRAAWDIVQQMHARYAASFPANEEGARSWTKMAIEQLVYSFPDDGYCWKSADAGRPPSKDGVGKRKGGRFDGWDLLHAAGAQGPRELARYPPEWHDLTGQHPIAVSGVNHLGAQPEPKPDPDPALAEQVKALQLALVAVRAELQTSLAGLKATQEQHALAIVDAQEAAEHAGRRVADVEQQFSKLRIGRTWGHSHSIGLEG